MKYFVTFKCFFRNVIWGEDASSNLLQSLSFIFHSLGMARSSPLKLRIFVLTGNFLANSSYERKSPVSFIKSFTQKM